jgi:hypothetical protein
VADFTSKQLERLQSSVNWTIRQIEYPRKKRVEGIKQFCGFHYQDGGYEKRVPVNMLALAVQIYVRQLAARAPRAMVSTDEKHLKPTALSLELAVNQIPEEIRLQQTLRRRVTEALFSIGIAKCGLSTAGSVNGIPYGKPFVDLVTLDDYFCDMTAKSWDQLDYEGNDYWADYEEIMESDDIKSSAKDQLEPDEYTNVGDRGEDRAEAISTDNATLSYREKLWMRDVFIPKEKIIVTYGVKSNKLFRVTEWKGVECGPYHKLGYTDVPGNLLPLSPVALWRDLHELGNAIFRKLGNQADSQKTVLGFNGGDDEGAEEFKKANDGDGIRYSGQKPEKLTAGGVDAKTLAFYLQCRDLYSYFAGNLDSLGGLAPLTDTVGQDKLLGAAASAQLRDMGGVTVDTITGIFQALAHYEWNDPVGKRTLEKEIPGTGVSIPVEWGRKQKKGDLKDYDISIDVYSLQDASPNVRLQKLGLITQQYVMPLAPLIQEAGGTIDVQAILRLVARYADMPEMAEIVTFMNPQLPQPQGGPGGAGVPGTSGGQQGAAKGGGSGMSNSGAAATLTQQLLAMEPKE